MINGTFRAVLTAVAAAGIGITAFGDRYLLVGTVCGIMALFAIGWARLLDIPARSSAIVLLLAVAAAATTTLLLWQDLLYVAVVAALGVVAAFLRELFRRDGRQELIESVSAVVTGIVVVTSAAGWIAIGTGPVSTALLLVGAVTLTASSTCTALPIPGWLSSATTIVIGLAAGAVTGSLIHLVGILTGAVIGLAAGILTATVHALFGRFPSSEKVLAALSAAMLPVAVSGIPVYVVGRLIFG